MRRVRWSEAELSRLQALWSEGDPDARIARILGRTVNAVARMRERRGLLLVWDGPCLNEVARRAGVSYQTVRKWRETGLLPGTQAGPRSRYVVDAAAFDRLMTARRSRAERSAETCG